MKSAPSSRITAVSPLWAVEGGRVTISGSGFSLEPQPPEVRLGGVKATRSPTPRGSSLTVIVPAGLDGGHTPVRVDSAPGETAYVEIGAPIATGVHQVDNPAFDHDGNLYVTFSGSRGQEAPVSIYVVRRDGSREPFVVGPAESDVDGRRSARAGCTCRAASTAASTASRATDRSTTVATDLGVACGIAFSRDGELFVGDRSGSVLRVQRRARDGVRRDSVERGGVPSRVRSRRLALCDSAPTLSSRDAVYRVSPDGVVETFCDGFGRPQGLAFDSEGHLYVVDAVAGVERRLPRPAAIVQRSSECVLVGRRAARPGLRSARRTRRLRRARRSTGSTSACAASCRFSRRVADSA